MPSRVIQTPEDLAQLYRFLRARKLPITVAWKAGAKRSHPQNRTMWMWADEAGRETFEAPEDVQARWKLMHGVPILRAEDEEFREAYDAKIKALPYEAKLAIMKLGFPVTSRMTTPQMIRFLDSVSAECAKQGIRLTEGETV